MLKTQSNLLPQSANSNSVQTEDVHQGSDISALNNPFDDALNQVWNDEPNPNNKTAPETILESPPISAQIQENKFPKIGLLTTLIVVALVGGAWFRSEQVSKVQNAQVVYTEVCQSSVVLDGNALSIAQQRIDDSSQQLASIPQLNLLPYGEAQLLLNQFASCQENLRLITQNLNALQVVLQHFASFEADIENMPYSEYVQRLDVLQNDLRSLAVQLSETKKDSVSTQFHNAIGHLQNAEQNYRFAQRLMECSLDGVVTSCFRDEQTGRLFLLPDSEFVNILINQYGMELEKRFFFIPLGINHHDAIATVFRSAQFEIEGARQAIGTQQTY